MGYRRDYRREGTLIFFRQLSSEGTIPCQKEIQQYGRTL